MPDNAYKTIKFPDASGPGRIGKGAQYITPATVKYSADGKKAPLEARFMLSNALDPSGKAGAKLHGDR